MPIALQTELNLDELAIQVVESNEPQEKLIKFVLDIDDLVADIDFTSGIIRGILEQVEVSPAAIAQIEQVINLELIGAATTDFDKVYAIPEDNEVRSVEPAIIPQPVTEIIIAGLNFA